MRTDEHIPSCIPTANPGIGGASPAGREPNPILIAQHRSQEPPGIAAGVASLGTVPSQHPAEPPPDTCLPGMVWWPWALRFNYPTPSSDAGGQEPGGPLASDAGRRWALPAVAASGTARLHALRSQIPLRIAKLGAEHRAPAAAHTSALAGCHHRPRWAGMSGPYPSPTAADTGVGLRSKGEILGDPPKNPASRGAARPTAAPQIPPISPKHHGGAGTKS